MIPGKRFLIRSYDINDLAGSGVSLRATARYLKARGHNVWVTNAKHTLAEIRAWNPDLIIGQQWATEEAGQWATNLKLPFVMFVHGPGQYECFWPQCDLVVFNSHWQHQKTRQALGTTPAMVLHPPVFRDEYATPVKGNNLTLIGSGAAKGVDVFIRLAQEMPEENFLLVTNETIVKKSGNMYVHSKVADMRSIYANTKMLLMPSIHESYGRVAVEAAMSGIPTVASDLPGIREATNGYAVFVRATKNWKQAVRRVLANLDIHRDKAIKLANLRDPSSELAALNLRLLQLAETGRRRPTLSLCMTVANEAKTLEKAVASVAPVVDDIIIGVDRKSSDETAAIAQRLANQYFEFSESDPPNFPRMRNRAMQRLQTDWAIVLDGHEWIENAERIPAALETTAWSLEIKTLFEPGENRVPSLAFPFPRIHRRHVRYSGAAAHEEVSTPMAQRESCPKIKVWHERKPGRAASRRQKEKSGSEIEVLRSAWIKQNDRRALFYMANGLREAGRFREAIKAYEEYLQAPNFEEEGWQATLFLARCYAALQEWSFAQMQFEQAFLKNPERAEAAIGLGHALLQQGRPREAAAWFRMATGLPEPQNCRLFVEVPAYRWQAWHGLALALDELGDYAGAAEAETKAKAGGAGTWADQNILMWQEKLQEQPCTA